jgi:hypothetical protein
MSNMAESPATTIDCRSTLRAVVHHIFLPASLDAQARAAVKIEPPASSIRVFPRCSRESETRNQLNTSGNMNAKTAFVAATLAEAVGPGEQVVLDRPLPPETSRS